MVISPSSPYDICAKRYDFKSALSSSVPGTCVGYVLAHEAQVGFREPAEVGQHGGHIHVANPKQRTLSSEYVSPLAGVCEGDAAWPGKGQFFRESW